MEENELNLSYIRSLPIEILIKLLRNVNTIDLISFCNSFPEYKYFFHEKALIRLVDFSNRNGVGQSPYDPITLMHMLKTEYITVLNISYVYWVAAADLRRVLKKLKNLEELYIVGTKVHMAKIDCESYKSNTLKKLAVSMEHLNFKNSKVAPFFPNLQNIYIEVISKYYRTFDNWIDSLIGDLKYLEKLWIWDLTDYPLNFNHIRTVSRGSSLKLFAFKTCTMFYNVEPTFNDLAKIIYKGQPGTEAYFERVNENAILNPRAFAESTGWQMLNELHSETPFGLNDAKKLMYKQVDINNIFFEELSFKHYGNGCCDRYIKAMIEIINSKNASRLKRLSLNNCLSFYKNLDRASLLDSSYNTSDAVIHPSKKKRLEDVDSRKHYHIYLENMATLKEFEIYDCSSHGRLEIYQSLARLTNLTKLTLEIPRLLNGDFLKEVFENCEMLETLRINVIATNENFNRDFCRYIKLAKNLKNLRYEHYTIYLENLFYGLAEMSVSTIQRLFLKCSDVEKYEIWPVVRFFKQNPQLHFVVIILDRASNRMIDVLNHHLRLFKKDNKSKIFVAKNQNGNLPTGNPEFYKSEVMSLESYVSTMNITDEFYYS